MVPTITTAASEIGFYITNARSLLALLWLAASILYAHVCGITCEPSQLRLVRPGFIFAHDVFQTSLIKLYIKH
jgi:hypothetical protein